MKIVIVGGGTAGWLSAAYFSKRRPDYSVTLIEDPNTPTIGVGESVTPHVLDFILKLGIDETEWMKETGAIHKLANKFIDWCYPGHHEYFSFTYPFLDRYIDTAQGYPENFEEYFYDADATTLDAFTLLYNTGKINKFDKFFNPQFSYMEDRTYHNNNLLQPHSISHHIDAIKTADFLKKNVAIPNGVRHIKDKVVNKEFDVSRMTSVVLESGQKIRADYFLDCTGFRREIINDLQPKFQKYDYPIDRAIVGRSQYIDPKKELTNYTQTRAKKHGWQFGVTLQKRQGNGYCFSSELSNVDEVYDDFLWNVQTEPREIKWEPGRLEYPCKSNVIAIGLSAGFVEPLEANNLYVVIRSIHLAAEFLENAKQNIESHSDFNMRMRNSLDDIKDFLIVHYTLANRTDSEFWQEMSYLGKKLNHEDLVRSKIIDKNNSMHAAFCAETMFPNYMWAQLAMSWNISIPTPLKPYKFEEDKYLEYFKKQYYKHKSLSQDSQKYYRFIKKLCQ